MQHTWTAAVVLQFRTQPARGYAQHVFGRHVLVAPDVFSSVGVAPQIPSIRGADVDVDNQQIRAAVAESNAAVDSNPARRNRNDTTST
jgi:hypothetical protein